MIKTIAILMLVGMVAGRATQIDSMSIFRSAMLSECSKYGAEDKVDKAVTSVLSFGDCIFRLIDMEAINRVNRAWDDKIANEFLNFVKLECENQAELLQCFNAMIDGVTPCVDPKQRNYLNVTKQSVADISNLLCEDESKTLSEFVNDGGYSCMMNKKEPLGECVNRLNAIYLQRLSEAERCTKTRAVSDCILDAMESCPKPTSAEFFRQLFRILYKGSSCQLHTQEDDKLVNVGGKRIPTEEDNKISTGDDNRLNVGYMNT